MFYTSERDKLRQVYADVWQKVKLNKQMDALEKMIASVIEMHPEYHAMLNNEKHLGNEYLPEMGETNPFLHMGMHLALQEHVSLDRPEGIQAIYLQLGEQTGSVEKTEHAMMDCLAESLWLAQKNQTEPDEQKYLACLKGLLEK
jgi:phage pi2 protein 07